MDNNDKIVNRVKALLARAEDQRGLPEGELAASIAARLMREHAIDQSQLEVKEKIIEVDLQLVNSNWLRNLLNAVANFCSCKCWLVSRTKQMKIAGYSADLEVCHYLFDLIRGQIEHEATKYVRSHPVGGKKVSNDFKRSAVVGVNAKLKKIKEQDRTEDPTGTALVFSRHSEVCSWVEQSIRLVNRSAPSFGWNSTGYNAGQNVRLSPGIGSQGTPPSFRPAPKLIGG